MDVPSDIFIADFERGMLFWKNPKSRRMKVGDEAGSKRPDGRTIVWVGGRFEYRYRVLWQMAYGYWPPVQIDHIDRDPSNDSLSNLRLATNKENSNNKGLNRNNKTGIKGVYKNSKGKYVAQITQDGVKKHIGTFNSLEEASEARATCKI